MDTKLDDEAARLRAVKRYSGGESGTRDFDAITALVCQVLDVPMCAVSIVEARRQNFLSVVGLDVTETSRDIAFCDHAIRGREMFVVPDTSADERFAANPLVTGGPRLGSYAGAPLTTPDGYNLGALCAMDSKPRVFTEADRALLSRFSMLVVEQLELRTLAHRDGLTGALARRAFDDQARAALAKLARDGTPAELLTFDLDHFKLINDRFGHGAGDLVLKETVARCQQALRPSDAFGRLGGEEFGIVLPSTGTAEAQHCAERLRHLIERMQIDGIPLVTASFGVASATAGDTLDSWLGRADAALYDAKRGGRNRVSVDAGEECRAAA